VLCLRKCFSKNICHLFFCATTLQLNHPFCNQIIDEMSRISMCFDLPWQTGFFAIAIANKLSQKFFVAPFCSWWRSASNFLSHNTWHVKDVAATYSASEEDNVVFYCLFELQVIAGEPRVKRFPETIVLSFTFPAQSLSKKP